jgi:GTPase SAR1 family protein
MTLNLRRPILVGGIGLSLGLWLLDSLQHSFAELGEVALLGVAAASVGFWWLKQGPKVPETPSPVNRETAEKAIAIAEIAINQLTTESPNCEANSSLTQRLSQLKTELDRQDLRISIVGGKAVGKTALMQLLQSDWIPQNSPQLNICEIAPLFTSQNEVKISSDLVLFITAGDITDPEFQVLSQLASEGQRLVLIWNKIDQCLPAQKSQVLQQLRQRMAGILAAEDIVAIASAPNVIKVRQHQPDGSLKEWMENPKPEIKPLTERLNQILTQENQSLVWANTIRLASHLKLEVKTALNIVRRERTLPVIEQYQYIAAAAAFANPVVALDLLATAAISTQMVIDIGVIYQQKFSLEQAKTVAGTLANQMLKLGLVELSTQAITAALKSNTITFVAGGVVQGVSAAYFTKIAGLSLIEYFQTQEVSADATDINTLKQQMTKTLQTVFQQNQQITVFQGFIKQVMQRLLPESPKSEMLSNA